MRAGGGPVVVAQWQSAGCTSQVSWVQSWMTAGYSRFASNSLYINTRRDIRVIENEAGLVSFIVSMTSSEDVR